MQSQGRIRMATKCDAKTEVYSRVCGFFRPVQQWNRGKKEEFRERREYVVGEGQKEE
ncbi:MAG TPA: anaerobic ribonucleoside-triphosphate reductase [Desulfuromonadales bacterium]